MEVQAGGRWPCAGTGSLPSARCAFLPHEAGRGLCRVSPELLVVACSQAVEQRPARCPSGAEEEARPDLRGEGSSVVPGGAGVGAALLWVLSPLLCLSSFWSCLPQLLPLFAPFLGDE